MSGASGHFFFNNTWAWPRAVVQFFSFHRMLLLSFLEVAFGHIFFNNYTLMKEINSHGDPTLTLESGSEALEAGSHQSS